MLRAILKLLCLSITTDKIVAVLDIDSPEVGRFDEEDKAGIEAIVKSFERSLAQ